MEIAGLWAKYFPDVVPSDLGWFDRYPESVLIRSFEITAEKDRLGRFFKRDGLNIGRYISGVAKKLSTRVASVTIDLILDYTITESDVQRFTAKLEPCGECLIFVPGDGVYGRFKCNGRAWGSHNFAFFNHHYGQLPQPSELAGVQVAHSCNQPRCCNPAHLRLTTRSVNLLERDLMSLGVSNTGSTLETRPSEKGSVPLFGKGEEGEVSGYEGNGLGPGQGMTL